MADPPRFYSDQLRDEVLAPKANIPAIVGKFGLPSMHAVMIERLVRDRKPNLTTIARVCRYGRGTVGQWARALDVPSQADKRAIAFYELSKENPVLVEVAEKSGLHVRRIWEVVATTGTQGQYYPSPKEDAMRAAIDANPSSTNKMIADHLGTGFDRDSVSRLRRKLMRSLDYLSPDTSREKLFLDAAAELVNRHLKADDSKLEQIKCGAKRPGWISVLEGRLPWPTSPESFPGLAVPRNRLLDAALTVYLQEAGIKEACELATQTEKAFMQLDKLPLPIFQALHYALAARDVTFDRLKIQHGYHQSWLPSRPQMIITAKQVLGLKR